MKSPRSGEIPLFIVPYKILYLPPYYICTRLPSWTCLRYRPACCQTLHSKLNNCYCKSISYLIFIRQDLIGSPNFPVSRTISDLRGNISLFTYCYIGTQVCMRNGCSSNTFVLFTRLRTRPVFTSQVIVGNERLCECMSSDTNFLDQSAFPSVDPAPSIRQELMPEACVMWPIRCSFKLYVSATLQLRLHVWGSLVNIGR